MTACPTCRWENDADTGPCAGCGRELSSSEPVRVPATPPVADPAPQPSREIPAETEAAAGLLRGPSRPVPIRPHAQPTPQVVVPPRGTAQPVERGRVSARPPAEAAPARRDPAPPVRAIPVVVAASGTRPAVRRRGEDSGGGLDGSLELPSMPQAGEASCPTCGRTVGSDQYFCRCGAQLPSAIAPRLQGLTAVDAAGMSIEAFRRAQRRANGGRRVRYDQPLSARTWLVRGLAVLVMAGALGSQLPPWGDDVRDWLQTRTAYASPWW